MFRLHMMLHHASLRTRGMACLVVLVLTVPILALSACGGSANASGLNTGGSGSSGGGITAPGDDVVQFTVSGAVSESRTLTLHQAQVTQENFVGANDPTGNKIFNFFINPSGNASDDAFSRDVTRFTAPGSYTLQWNDQDQLENLAVGLAYNGGVDWSLQDSPGKFCQATVSSASPVTSSSAFTMEAVKGTFSYPELDAKALFNAPPIHVTNGSFTVFVRAV